MRTRHVRRKIDVAGERIIRNGLGDCEEMDAEAEDAMDACGSCAFEDLLRDAGPAIGQETDGSSLVSTVTEEPIRYWALAGVEPERLRVREGEVCNWRCMCACCVCAVDGMRNERADHVRVRLSG